MNTTARAFPTFPLYVLFFLSGAAGLVYEVIWMRMLAVTLGVTAPAVAAVLAAFMGGLALGSWLGGRWLDRWGRPLLWYAACELFISLFALAFPLLYRAADGVYLLAALDGAAPAVRDLVRFGVAAALLVLPTAAMGATTPAITAILRERTGATAGRSFAAAYAANTFGAAAGVLTGGFWLLWAAGARTSLIAVAALNAAVAASAFVLHVKTTRLGAGLPPAAEEAATATKAPSWPSYAAAFLMGAVAIAAQVLWNRALSNVVGSGTYAFSAMLAVILLAIGVGALIHRLLKPTASGARGLYSGVCLAAAASLALSVLALSRAPYIFLAGFGAGGCTFAAALTQVFVLSFLVLFLPSLALGIVLPIAVAAARARGLGSRVGGVYAANTAGAIVGSIAGTFALLPTAGPIGGLRVLAVIAAGAAFLWGWGKRWWVLTAAAAAACAAACFIPGPSRHELIAGVGISPSYYLDEEGKVDLSDAAHEKMLFYADSVDASVAVVEYGVVRSLKINGKVVASTNYDDLRVENTLGELPRAAYGDTRGKKCLVIGLGTGITLGACAADAGYERIVCVEINPAVPPASRYFDEWSGAPLDDARVEFRRDDGRSYVRATRERFDVITSDPLHPWTKGSAALYTTEHFTNCKRILEPRGVMAQWLPLYRLSPPDYFTVIRTFADVFPYVSLYYTGRDTVLLGSVDPPHWPPAHAPYMMAEGDVLRDAARIGYVNTEDNMVLEYTAPRSLYLKTEHDNLKLLSALRSPRGDARYVAVNRLLAGRLAYIEGEDDDAIAAYEDTLALWPDNDDARHCLADIYFDRAMMAAEEKDREEACRLFRRVLELTPGDVAAETNLALLGG